MTKQLNLILILTACFFTGLAQQNVGINTTTPDPSAALHVEATNTGVLVPRLTTAQRELISNASDALDKIRYMILTSPEKYKEAALEELPLEVKIEYDELEQTLTIRESGIGMTKDDMVKNLGTVARSGTTKFFATLQ